MTTEEKKMILRSYRVRYEAAKRIKEQIYALETSAMGRAVSMDGMPRGSGGSDLSGFAVKYAEMEDRLKKAYEAQLEAGSRIMDAIMRLDDPLQSTVLFEHYISFKRIERIARELHYCEDKIWKTHRKGIANIRFEKVT